jgi:glutamate/tyrosine decarboxylase-like PLP-dependent enzyme
MVASGTREALESAFRYALDYLDGLDSTPVAGNIDRDALRKRFDEPLSDQGIEAAQVVADLVKRVEGGLLGSAGGRFFGWVRGGSLPAALAADWLASAWDQNAAFYAAGPAASIVEEVVGEWLKDIFELPADVSFALVTGCQMAHVTCLAAARHFLLAKSGWDVERLGLHGAAPIRILCGWERHGSVDRAVRLLGLGLRQMVNLGVDSAGTLCPSALQHELESHAGTPTIVVLTAGDVNMGNFDDFRSLIGVAKGYGAWVHIDGAFGLWAAATPKYRHLLAGASEADSWSVDGHKWLNVPYDCGYAFVAHPEPHRAAMSHRAPYVTLDSRVRDQLDWNPEWSRRARGFATYAALRQLGRDGVAELVERCCRHAHSLVAQLESLPGAEVVCKPVINQGLVRFLAQGVSVPDQEHDRRTNQVIEAVRSTGEAFFSGTTWHGRRAMRISVCNWQTSETDIARAINAVASVLTKPTEAAP